MLPAVQKGVIPQPEEVASILQDLQSSEADLRQSLQALNALPPSRDAGELVARLGLRHGLTRLIAEMEPLQTQLGYLQKILSHPGGVN